MHNAVAFIWKIDSGSASEVEGALGLQEILCAHGCTNLHHGIIAGIGNSLCKGLHAMTVDIRTLDGSHISFHTKVLESIAVECVACGNFALLQSCCHNNGLHNRTRFINICNAEVVPSVA